MDNNESIKDCLDIILNIYKESVTDLSKTENNYFIQSNTQMFDWDKLAKITEGENLETVDAIYCYSQNNDQILYFFEFKKLNLLDDYFDVRKKFGKIINEMDNCEYNCDYVSSLRKIKKKVIAKKVISLKLKPIESLILLNDYLRKHNINNIDLSKIRKEYYIVSLTKIPKGLTEEINKNNFRRKNRAIEIFNFINKISPYPFSHVEPITKKTFLKLISDLERKQNFANTPKSICNIRIISDVDYN